MAVSKLYVSNTLVSDNGESGIVIGPSGPGTLKAILNHVEINNNVNFGLAIDATSQTIHVTVTDSTSTNNGTDGINSAGGGVIVRNSTIANNSGTGVVATGNGLILTRSSISGNNKGIDGKFVFSYGDNDLDDEFLSELPLGPLSYD